MRGGKFTLCIFSRDLRGGRKGDHEVIQVEVTIPKLVVESLFQKVEKDAAVEKISTEKPKEEENKKMNVKIEKGKENEKAAIKIEEKIIEEKKDGDAAICIYGMKGK